MNNSNWISLKMVYKGVEITFTQEDPAKEMKPYFEQAKRMIDYGLTNEFTAVPPRSYGFPKKEAAPKEYADYACPECGGKVIKTITKQGKKKESCENQKYDFTTKVLSGCSYIKWIND